MRRAVVSAETRSGGKTQAGSSSRMTLAFFFLFFFFSPAFLLFLRFPAAIVLHAVDLPLTHSCSCAGVNWVGLSAEMIDVRGAGVAVGTPSSEGKGEEREGWGRGGMGMVGSAACLVSVQEMQWLVGRWVVVGGGVVCVCGKESTRTLHCRDTEYGALSLGQTDRQQDLPEEEGEQREARAIEYSRYSAVQYNGAVQCSAGGKRSSRGPRKKW
ncbi:hypothetical protein CGRA01v4_00131 [Colletotrichum graminicola]|nr:hypothetical protein CGRA01v4_00131 [Colletotrichum graminicola]